MKLVTVEEMRKIETEANQAGMSYAEMMENAGRGLADEVNNAHSHSGNKTALGLVGPGNNGGDTLIALEYLAASGWNTYAYLVKKRPPEDHLSDRLIKAGGEVIDMADDQEYQWLGEKLVKASVLLDGILGTGIKLPLRDDISKLLFTIKELLSEHKKTPLVVAVEVPTGIDADSGETADETLQADLTISMAAIKVGLLRYPASRYIGQIKVVDIGISPEQPGEATNALDVVDQEMVRSILPKRSHDAHKGTFGTVMVLAGSTNYTGAALLAGKGAYRSGVGLVTMGVPAPLHAALAGHFLEATWLLLPHELGVISSNSVDLVRRNLGSITALLLGPGWGQEETTFQFLSRLLDAQGVLQKREIGFVVKQAENPKSETKQLPALVLDADALKLLTRIEAWQKKLPPQTILTPHPGEMSVLTGLSIEEIQKDRLNIAQKFAQEWGQIVILKGAYTVIAGDKGEAAVVPVANAALARAGTGDVLAGVVAGLRAQGVSAFQAALGGAWIHAQAGLVALKHLGSPNTVLAGDVLEGLVDVFRDIEANR